MGVPLPPTDQKSIINMVEDSKAEVSSLHTYDEDQRSLEKRLVRKLDMTLMPVVWMLYFFNYLDRNNIAYDFFFHISSDMAY
jgi:hypothetical protein